MLEGFDAMLAAAKPGQQNPPILLNFQSIDGHSPFIESLAGFGFGIDYRDSKGAETRRWVKILSVKTEPKFRLSAFCFTDKGLRTLRPEGILSVVDVNGVVESGEQFFARFGMTVLPAKAPPITGGTRAGAYPVVIKCMEQSYIATPSAFPACAGAGTTPQAAMAAVAQKLADHLAVVAAAGTALPTTNLPPPDEGDILAWLAVAVAAPTGKRR